jgi:hypothetical protein
MTKLIALGVFAILVAGCRISPAVTSGDEATAAVPVTWSLHESTRPDGNQLRLYGGTLHSIPSSLRLVSPSGHVLSSAVATFSPSGGAPCGDTQAVGAASAELALPGAEVANFRAGWPAGYRVEAEVAGVWKSTALTYAGCNTSD